MDVVDGMSQRDRMDDCLNDWNDSGLSSWVPCKTGDDAPERFAFQEKAVPSI